MKFCVNCGAEIPQDAKFCPKCGFKQPVLVDEQGKDSQEVNNEKQIPVAEEHPSTALGEKPSNENSDESVAEHVVADNVGKSAKDMLQSQILVGPLTKDAAVVEHKVALGYSDRTDNYVFAGTPINLSEIVTSLRGFLGLKSKNYIMAFEDGGILLMGCLGMQKFTGDDIFIESSRISNMRLENFPLAQWDHMYLTVDDKELELLIASIAIYGRAMWFMIPWHNRNAKKLLKYS
ncbi:zinc ribbon domain-containing protein [Lacticaseibacillus saniviri]